MRWCSAAVCLTRVEVCDGHEPARSGELPELGPRPRRPLPVRCSLRLALGQLVRRSQRSMRTRLRLPHHSSPLLSLLHGPPLSSLRPSVACRRTCLLPLVVHRHLRHDAAPLCELRVLPDVGRQGGGRLQAAEAAAAIGGRGQAVEGRGGADGEGGGGLEGEEGGGGGEGVVGGVLRVRLEGMGLEEGVGEERVGGAGGGGGGCEGVERGGGRGGGERVEKGRRRSEMSHSRWRRRAVVSTRWARGGGGGGLELDERRRAESGGRGGSDELGVGRW